MSDVKCSDKMLTQKYWSYSVILTCILSVAYKMTKYGIENKMLVVSLLYLTMALYTI